MWSRISLNSTSTWACDKQNRDRNLILFPLEYGFSDFPCPDRNVVMPEEGFVEEKSGLGNGSLVEMISAREGPK